jgi:hypothetical protein
MRTRPHRASGLASAEMTSATSMGVLSLRRSMRGETNFVASSKMAPLLRMRLLREPLNVLRVVVVPNKDAECEMMATTTLEAA